jgi:hypothetical protein
MVKPMTRPQPKVIFVIVDLLFDPTVLTVANRNSRTDIIPRSGPNNRPL